MKIEAIVGTGATRGVRTSGGSVIEGDLWWWEWAFRRVTSWQETPG